MSASQGGSRGASAAARSVEWVTVAWPAALQGGRSITRGVYSHRLFPTYQQQLSYQTRLIDPPNPPREKQLDAVVTSPGDRCPCRGLGCGRNECSPGA